MHVVRLLAMILLAVFLFFSGLLMLTEMNMPALGTSLIGLVGMAAGVLILVSLGAKEKS